MKSQNDYIFSLYKPFRNQLRKYELFDSLQLIWAYSRNFTFNYPFPKDIELPAGFVQTDSISNRRHCGMPEHEQEYILKEIILNCSTVRSKYSLKNKDNLARLVNYLRHTFNEEIDKKYSMSSDFLLEFNRMVHRQFRWQLEFDRNEILRYYKIYSNKEVNNLIVKILGLNSFELFIMGFYFFGLTAQQFQLPLPFISHASIITNEMLVQFFKHFAMPVEQAKSELEEAQQMNENIFYSYNPLIAKPILTYQNTFFCPIPLLLYWQITNGIYYSIVDEKGFDNAFGNSFQNYIGEVLTTYNAQNNFQIIPEATFGKEEKRTVDWIVIDGSSILFIECKTKRMTMISKTELDIKIKKGMEDDIMKMAGFVVQVYKTYCHYINNKYENIKFDSTKKFIPLILTLEDWHISLNNKLMNMLKEAVIEKFKIEKLDSSLLESNPYHIRSCETFEKDFQIMKALGIANYFEKVVKNELHEYIKTFKYEDVFEGAFKTIFIDPLKQQK